MTPHTGTKPIAVLVNRNGFVYTLNKAGKHFLAAGLISDISFGQNVLVSGDFTTSYIEVDAVLHGGLVDDVVEYIQGLNRISYSSTQGGYAKTAWYCTLEDFGKCLDESGDRKFTDIASRWNKLTFEESYKIQPITLADLKPFTYENFAGFRHGDSRCLKSGMMSSL